MRRTKVLSVIVISIVSLLVMMYVEKVIQPGYWIKSLVKIVMFMGGMLLYAFMFRKDMAELIGLKMKKPSKKLVLSVVFAYAGIIILYLLLKDHIDLMSIRDQLLAKEHLSRDNFLFIFSYIILVNSFLEESFFRGFIYNALKDEGFGMLGVVFSALMFALYHISIVDTWFSSVLVFFSIAGLCVIGAFLQYIAIKEDNLLGSWLVHAAANLAINTIGTIMLFR